MTLHPRDWLHNATRGAPAALRRRVEEHTAAAGDAEASVPDTLAASAFRALDAVVGQPADRSAALDLLSADALITLALLAQAEADPEALEALADRLLRSGAGGAREDSEPPSGHGGR